ncbi:MAG: IPTL-CTERM sorting domain-containing protein [Phycisphaerae bacterium]|jgi:hypothetical protein
MTTRVQLLVASLVVLCVMRTARAEPAWGVNCLSCHGDWQAGALSIIGADTTADPDESATGAPDRGVLPVFRVMPGQTKTLQVEVVDLGLGDVYAVELKRFRFPGVVSGGELSYTDDCNWAYWGEPGKYYTDPAIGYSWGSGPTTFAFEIGANFDAPEDYYDLVFAVVGKFADDGALFTTEEHLYLQVTSTPAPGDLDGDGDVDWDDFDIFVVCFTESGGRIIAGCEACDLNADEDLDCGDWVLFQQAWTDPDPPPDFAACGADIPTVSEWGLILLALLMTSLGTMVLRIRKCGERTWAG